MAAPVRGPRWAWWADTPRPFIPGLVVVVGVLLLASPCLGQLQALTNQGLTVYYEPRDQSFAEDALHAAMASLPTLQSALGMSRDPGGEISLIVTRSDAVFNQYAGEKMLPWVQGVALPGRRVVLKTLAPAVMRTVWYEVEIR